MYRNLFILFIAILLSSCSIKLPDIKITGEKTALENQILGEYKKIKEDVWLIASERSSVKLTIPVDNSKVLKAVRDRLFYKDDITEYKIKGVVGEKRNGLIAIIENKNYLGLTNDEKKLVDKILIKDNEARTIILSRILELNPSLNKYNKSEIEIAFFNMMLDESPDKSYYRNRENKWEQK